MKRVYILDQRYNQAYARMFEARGTFVVVPTMEAADLVQFTGGEDVTPLFYQEATHPRTSYNKARDAREIRIYIEALGRGIPCAGICRGGQFLNVMNGGEMIQDLRGHAISGTHLAEFRLPDGLHQVPVTSTHHQMMVPGPDGVVLGTADDIGRNKERMRGTDIVGIEDPVDIESVYYPSNRTLCFQPHPEFVERGHPCQEVYFHLLEEYLGV